MPITKTGCHRLMLSVAAAALISTTLNANAVVQLYSTYQPNPNTFQSTLYDVSVQTGNTTPLINLGTSFFSALAFDHAGQLFGASSTLWKIDITNGVRQLVGSLPAVMNSITFMPDGNIVAFAPNALYRIDPKTANVLSAKYVTSIGTFIQGGIAADETGTLYTVGLRPTATGILSTISVVDPVSGVATDLGVLTEDTPNSYNVQPSGAFTYAGDGIFYSIGAGGPGRPLFQVDASSLKYRLLGFSGSSPPCICYNSLAALAPTVAVPESASNVLLLFGLAAIALPVVRRRVYPKLLVCKLG